MPTPIKTMAKLKALARQGVDCYILLRGCFRSSKSIEYDAKKKEWLVFHDIDGTTEIIKGDKELKLRTSIVEAMEKGALFMY